MGDVVRREALHALSATQSRQPPQSIRRKAIKLPCTPGAHQRFLAATCGLVREVPGLGPVVGIWADAVMVADDG